MDNSEKIKQTIIRAAILKNVGWDNDLVKYYMEDALYKMEKDLSEEENHIPRVPSPMTSHPGLEHVAPLVRSFNRSSFLLPLYSIGVACSRDDGRYPDSESVVKKIVLNRKWCTGPMPYVGTPETVQYYMWPVWLDEAGRYITGEAQIKTIERPKEK